MRHARRLATALHRSTLKMVPSAGHLFPLVIADEILEDLALIWSMVAACDVDGICRQPLRARIRVA